MFSAISDTPSKHDTFFFEHLKIIWWRQTRLDYWLRFLGRFFSWMKNTSASCYLKQLLFAVFFWEWVVFQQMHLESVRHLKWIVERTLFVSSRSHVFCTLRIVARNSWIPVTFVPNIFVLKIIIFINKRILSFMNRF